MEPGDCKNKNALALVDKKMKELEDEIKKASPKKNTLTVKTLARATAAVNEKISHQGLSAKEILFSRDQFTSDNLEINDEELAEEKMKIRERENVYNAKSKSTISTPAVPANARKGQLVFLKKDGSKLERRDLYLVTEANVEDGTVSLCKLPSVLSGTEPVQFQPHNITYKVNQTDIFLSPNQPIRAEILEEYEEWEEVYEDQPLSEEVKRAKVKYYPYDDEDDEDDYWDHSGDNQEQHDHQQYPNNEQHD